MQLNDVHYSLSLSLILFLSIKYFYILDTYAARNDNYNHIVSQFLGSLYVYVHFCVSGILNFTLLVLFSSCYFVNILCNYHGNNAYVYIYIYVMCVYGNNSDMA